MSYFSTSTHRVDGTSHIEYPGHCYLLLFFIILYQILTKSLFGSLSLVFRFTDPKFVLYSPLIDGFASRAFVRGTQGRSVSLRSPTKNKETLGKVLPLRWSFGSKDRKKVTSVPQITTPQTGELVEYLESGRRPRCTKEPIVSLVASPAQGKAQLPVDDSLSSPSGSSGFSGAERGSCRESDSPRVPEGQSRPGSDRSASKGRDEGLLVRRTSKRRQEQHGKSQDGQSCRESSAGVQPGTSTAQSLSNSTSESKDSTIKRHWNQPGGATRTFCSQNQKEDVAGSKNEETDGIPAFLMPGNVKKDNQSKNIRAKETAQGRTITHKSSNKLSVSNGTPNGLVAEEKKGNGSHRSSSARYYNKTLINGKDSHSGSGGDIKRALSSSSLQSRLDLNLRRTVSLQRNGLLVPPQKGQSADKPSYNTLQRNRYSTTSLGRQKPVPESCF